MPLVAWALFTLLTSSAYAEGQEAKEQGADDIDDTIIVGVGGAEELQLRDGSLHPGANLMVEWEAIENWLELEVEASILSADGGVEMPLGLLIKRPFRLTRRAEFMIGVGPELVRVSNPMTKPTYGGAQLALDFMFLTSQHVGLWSNLPTTSSSAMPSPSPSEVRAVWSSVGKPARPH